MVRDQKYKSRTGPFYYQPGKGRKQKYKIKRNGVSKIYLKPPTDTPRELRAGEGGHGVLC